MKFFEAVKTFCQQSPWLFLLLAAFSWVLPWVLAYVLIPLLLIAWAIHHEGCISLIISIAITVWLVFTFGDAYIAFIPTLIKILFIVPALLTIIFLILFFTAKRE